VKKKTQTIGKGRKDKNDKYISKHFDYAFQNFEERLK